MRSSKADGTCCRLFCPPRLRWQFFLSDWEIYCTKLSLEICQARSLDTSLYRIICTCSMCNGATYINIGLGLLTNFVHFSPHLCSNTNFFKIIHQFHAFSIRRILTLIFFNSPSVRLVNQSVLRSVLHVHLI